MEWHWTELPSLLHHLPEALHDLLTHEDRELVKAALHDIRPPAHADAVRHRLILPDAVRNAADATPSESSIEKTMDAGVLRAEQNLHLLAQDYLAMLPDYQASSAYAEKLIEHWHRILLEQPKRLSEVQMAHHKSERTREFWAERLKQHASGKDADPHMLSIIMENWQRADTPASHPHTLGARQTRQWQDLVIRNRLHLLTLYQEPYGWQSSPERNSGHR